MRPTVPLLVLLVLILLPLGSFAHPATTSQAPALREGAEGIARTHLLNNAATYGVHREDMAGLRLQTERTDRITGAHYLYFIQTVHDLDIYDAIVNVTLAPDGTVVQVGNRAQANLTRRATTATPTISPAQAISASAEALGLAYTPATVIASEAGRGAAQATDFRGGDLSLERIPVQLIYQPTTDGALRLAWDLSIYQLDARHWWSVRVDAATGEMLDRADWVVHDEWGTERGTQDAETATYSLASTDTGANGFVGIAGSAFRIPLSAPNASTTIEATSLLTGTYRVFPIPIESPSIGPRQLVANPANATASPFGWHDTNGASGAEFTTTQGNNTHAYSDADGNQLPDAGSSPDGGAGLLFDFPLDLTQAPSTYRPAALSHYFYWTNLLHDISYLYGFDEAAGNFQENNYGNGGMGSDYLYAEGQDGSGTNGGNFSTPPDGTNPRMQMFIWTLTTPHRDGVFDNGVVAHEYGHGISNRLTGGPSNVSCLQNAEAMGEGWSDWQALVLTMRATDTATQNRGIGTYILGQPPTGAGIRIAPYTTDFTFNDYTYADLATNPGAYGAGFIWATMVWELNWELIAAHGFNPDIYDTAVGGNTLTYKLVQDGMAIQPCSPGFVDGRNAILAADTILTGGANQCLIWAAFARRGLGASASQGSSNSTTDGTAAFNLPPECSGPTPTPSNTALPSTATPTATSVPPTATATSTTIPATVTPTATGVPATATATPTVISATATPTVTGVPATATPTATKVPTTVTPTATGVPTTATPTATEIPATATATVTATMTGEPPLKELFLPAIQRE
jgi:hypothetical protein